MDLRFNIKDYETAKISCRGREMTFRCYEHIPYCAAPEDAAIQRLSVYIPEDYFNGRRVNGYSAQTAPIFLANDVGGYMPGHESRPGIKKLPPYLAPEYSTYDIMSWALMNGCVVVSCGVRGRGMKDPHGKNIGIAPAAITDLKAAVRYLRYNSQIIPGDTERIISNGTSAGGALSALLGCTGNHPDYIPYLENIGAADARDDIFAASCYCPITELDHADMAYEWEFAGIYECRGLKLIPPDGNNGWRSYAITRTLTAERQELSVRLCVAFPGYINSLDLKDENGRSLALGADGQGSFKEYLANGIVKSAQEELKRLSLSLQAGYISERYQIIRKRFANTSASPEECGAFSICDGQICGVDLDAFARFRTRMKPAPAFDSIENNTPENELFGSETADRRHFTRFSYEEDTLGGLLAEPEQVKLMDPICYIDDDAAVKAGHFRILHGAADRDTSLAISEILGLKLSMACIDARVIHPWGVPHDGDYDPVQLMEWINSVV